MQEELILHVLTTGEQVVWKPQLKCIAVLFAAPRKVLSTSLLHGGYREELTGIFNHNCGPDDGSHAVLRAASYREHLQLLAREAGLDPFRTTGMGTAASMENVAIVDKQYQELTVTAIVTAGVEGNGGRVGDPAWYYAPGCKTAEHTPGTINIMLVIDCDMPPGTLARAVVTCTEAKTAALQELMVGSLYSAGLATGSGTDQTIAVANPQSPLYLEGAGKHSKLGELIGLAVKEAVTEALNKQNGLTPQRQHSMLRRFKRFGMTEESLWQEYLATAKEPMRKQEFLCRLYERDREDSMLTYASLYIHLMDQYLWGLLAADEMLAAANEILNLAGGGGLAASGKLMKTDISTWLAAWNQLILATLSE